MATGWISLANTWYYLTGSGAMATGWINLSGTWYYLHGSGAMATGWINLGGTWYYLSASGAMAANQWIDNAYWVGSSGAMATSVWVDGGRYWVDESGRWQPSQGSSSSSGATWDGHTVYITRYGKRWHKSAGCPSLHDKHYWATDLSKVDDRTYCHICAR